MVTKKWFAGTYKFTNTQINQSYNTTYTEEDPSLGIFYDDNGSFESIGLSSYKTMKIVNNTYYLKEIYLDEENEDAPPEFSKETYTLIKINN